MIDGFADYQVAESLKLELDYSDEKSDFRKTNFPARYIYERLIPTAFGVPSLPNLSLRDGQVTVVCP